MTQSVKVCHRFPCALLYAYFIWRPLHFFGNNHPLLFLFLCYPYFGTFLFHINYNLNEPVCFVLFLKGPLIKYIRIPREGGSNSFLYFPSQYFILEIARSKGLARIIFHLYLEGKNCIRMSFFLTCFKKMINLTPLTWG